MVRRASIELVVATLASVISVIGVFHASGFPRASAYLPTAVLIIMTALLVLWAAQAFIQLRRNQSYTISLDKGETRRFFLITFSSAALIAVVSVLGFLTSFLLFIPLAGYILGYRHWKPLLLATVVFTIIVFLIFRVLLDRPLPPELIIQLF